jgi:hypothetical protein
MSTRVEKNANFTIFASSHNDAVTTHLARHVIAWVRNLAVMGEELPTVTKDAVHLRQENFFVSPRTPIDRQGFSRSINDRHVVSSIGPSLSSV